ncbi:Formylglycine-generating sulfatase enzyme [compost metagenome]
MHGLVWEWTSDFNSIFLSGESRKDKSSDQNLFCGSASVNAADLMDYAAFMRYAFRGSLKAQYSTRNLGFRCASTIKPKI